MGVIQRYASLLPVTDKTPLITLGEGNTPLVHLEGISRELEIDLWGKLEGCNPSGSFKDRGMVMAVAKALESGAKALVCASTGNTSASAAAYAAAAQIPCYVLLPAGKVALGKLAQALMYGAEVIAVKGNFDRALEMAREAADEKGYAIVNSVNPYRLWGQRSGAWEVCEDLGAAPDWHAIPVGNAGNISAYWAGYRQYEEIGKIKALPKMMGFQAAGAAPLVTGEPCPEPETIATAIRIGNPVSAHLAKDAVKESNGEFNSVTDEEILSAQYFLSSKGGIFAEPASCAPLAGLVKLKKLGRLPKGIRVVMVLTGNGLKDPDTAMSQVGRPIEIGDTLAELLEVMKG
ncbi:MAG: threonine synthase [Synergistaceae bacterium]|jgi:threonine synthase|nr:threonine synthase [Synergistaceae bacterium]MBP9559615.1 threonine synthase [Synergistaceae bacterium]MBP9975475.1 threonine synthase [Synergistaceae bacterium]PKL05549.1 MAG: threonine synthase [Synergistetes bacterium HGW-Synergistetes-1]